MNTNEKTFSFYNAFGFIGLWRADYSLGRWFEIKWGVYAAVRTDNHPNQIEVKVIPNGSNGRVDIHVSVNGQKLFEPPSAARNGSLGHVVEDILLITGLLGRDPVGSVF